MPLHPINALDHVIDEYADYLRTEFLAKDPKLQEALERELDAPGFLAQELFYQAHCRATSCSGSEVSTRFLMVFVCQAGVIFAEPPIKSATAA